MSLDRLAANHSLERYLDRHVRDAVALEVMHDRGLPSGACYLQVDKRGLAMLPHKVEQRFDLDLQMPRLLPFVLQAYRDDAHLAEPLHLPLGARLYRIR